MATSTSLCRHRGTWLIGGGSYEWCFECGSLRRMRETGIAACTPDSLWLRPVGVGAPNPHGAWAEKSKRYIDARRAKADKQKQRR